MTLESMAEVEDASGNDAAAHPRRRRTDHLSLVGTLVDPEIPRTLDRKLVALLLLERAVLALTGLVVLVLAWRLRDAPFPWRTTVFVLVALGALSMALRWRLQRGVPSENEFLLHVLADLALLTFAFDLSGGVENPFLVFYMLPLTLAAYAMSWPRIVACVAAVLAMLALLAQSPPAMYFDEVAHEVSDVVALSVIAYFAFAVARLSRGQMRRDAAAREAALDELGQQALGAVAARAADALGSPLSTMSVLVHELRQGRLTDHERQGALETLDEQILLCKSRLSELLSSVGRARGDQGGARDIGAVVQMAVAECELADTSLRVEIDQPTQRAPQVVAERSLLDALILLIRHCGHVSPHRVRIDIRWTPQWVSVGLQGRDRAPAEPDESIALAAALLGKFNGSLRCRVAEQRCFLQVLLPAMATHAAS